MSAITFRKDGERYIVFLGEDRIGFVRQEGDRWNAGDTYMAWAKWFPTRAKAGEALKKRWEKQGSP